MIGIGTPISHNRIERMTTAPTCPLGGKNEPAPQRFQVSQSASAAVAGSACCSRRPTIAARSMIVAA